LVRVYLIDTFLKRETEIFMATSLKSKFQYKVQFPLQYIADSMLVHMRAGSSAITRILVASDGLAFTSEQQFAPLLANRRRIADELGVVFDQQSIDDVLTSSAPISSKYSAIFAKFSFLTPAQEALDKIARLRGKLAPGAKLVYFDGDDDLCVQWGTLVEFVDLYAKKHVFADTSWYRKEFVGKNNLTDYVARVSGRSFTDDPIPHSGTVPDQHTHKIFAAYNIGLDEKITNLFRDTRPASQSEKTVDVMCRAACAPDNWLYSLRGAVGAALEPLRHQGFNVLLPDKRVDQKAYYEEMRSSRICISPFGYGELCWRDFETVLMGSLLVKPDMSHVRTEPNIFIPGETYVPVRWDYSDLAEVCERYLADDAERNRITTQAYRVLSDYYSNSGFLKCFSKLLAEAGIQPFTRTMAANFAETGLNS
jgi:hypothetical protein